MTLVSLREPIQTSQSLHHRSNNHNQRHWRLRALTQASCSFNYSAAERSTIQKSILSQINISGLLIYLTSFHLMKYIRLVFSTLDLVKQIMNVRSYATEMEACATLNSFITLARLLLSKTQRK